jgi:outer membrane protein TolC
MPQSRPAPATGRFIEYSLIALLLLGGAPAVRAEGLTLAEAERIAVERDATLRSLAAESEAMRDRAVAESQLMDPKLRVGAVNVPVDSFSFTAEDMTMVEVGVSQEFPAAGVRKLTRQKMDQSAAAAEALAADRKRTVRREVRRVWAELAYVSGARELLTAQQSWVDQMRASARARYASGEGKQLDLLQAGLDAAMLREQQLDLDRDEAMRKAQLARWVGDDEARSAGPFSLPARAELPPIGVLEDRLMQHPAQADYDLRIEAAKTSVALAEKSKRPGWMLDLSYGLRSGQDAFGMNRSDMLSAMVTVDLPVFRGNRQDRQVSAALADARGLQDMHDDHRREMHAMLDEAWATARKTADLEKFYESDLLPLADQSVDAALLAWRSNRAMIDEVVAARRVALETRLKHLRLAADRAQAQFDIDYLAGEVP